MRCGHERDGMVCGSAEAVRLYLVGPRCPQDSPAALAGRADHQPDLARTLEALRPRPFTFRSNDTSLVDARAVASGKRRSGRAGYLAAQAELEQLRERLNAPKRPVDRPAPPPVALCPGCGQDPVSHQRNCPMGPRARFAFAPGGRILGTARRGPELPVRTDRLGVWLRGRSDRCSWCGHHPEKQGHAEWCPAGERLP